jgi:hypothetical protein
MDPLLMTSYSKIPARVLDNDSHYNMPGRQRQELTTNNKGYFMFR